MLSRNNSANIANETVDCCLKGEYSVGSTIISIGAKIKESVDATKHITLEDMHPLVERSRDIIAKNSYETKFEVCNETSLSAGKRLFAQDPNVAILNFASAKHPGGGFLNGALAQEESIARASSLYPSLMTQNGFYAAYQKDRNPFYADQLIVSPNVVIFRDDNGEFLEQPWTATVITAAAPNAGHIVKNRQDIPATFRIRIGMILTAAVLYKQSSLVLGAWGCGVFANDPKLVANIFAEHLLTGTFSKAFRHVTFAILDGRSTMLEPFKIFGSRSV
jgi:uncharacterized protein (TIGR02452 family)